MTFHPTVGWPARIDAVKPTVLILGGFLTAPPLYGPMRRRLMARGAAGVVVARIWTPDWILAGGLGLGPIVRRSEAALRSAIAATVGSPASLGAPILLIGHSAGGILGRILLSERPYADHRHGHAADIGALVTIGTPHHVEATGELGRQVIARASRWLDRTEPGAFHAPSVGYLTVASRAVVGRSGGIGRERVAQRAYRGFIPDLDDSIAGDGVVPVESALLDGATQVVLDDIVHGQAGGRPWYGSDRALDHWWPRAVQVWREGLRARLASPAA